MKLVLDNIIFELQRAGGISKIWAKHIEYLSKNDISFIMCEGSNAHNNVFRKELGKVNVFTLPELNIPLAARRYLSVNTGDGDVFHSSYYRASKKKIKNVVTIHDFMYEKYDKGLKKIVHSIQKVNAMKKADALICVSNHTKMDMYEIYPWTETKEVFVVYNGVDEDFFPLSEKRERFLVGGFNLTNKKYLLYVGARGYCKNFGRIIDMMQSDYVRDSCLRLVCVGGGDFSEHEKQKLKDAGIYDNIIKFNNITSEDLNLLYNHAKALLFPSIYEGFGIPALEAARAGCLVLPSKSSSIPEVVGVSDFLFDPESISDAINSIEKLDNDELIHANIKKQYEHSLTFSWDKTSKQTVDVYKSLF